MKVLNHNLFYLQAYRTALKLRALQKELKSINDYLLLHFLFYRLICTYIYYIVLYKCAVDKLPLKTVVDTFDSLGLRGHNDRLLDVPDMISTLNTLYNLCLNQQYPMQTSSGKNSSAPISAEPVNIPYISDMAINWLVMN